jgi:hypothetical protein
VVGDRLGLGDHDHVRALDLDDVRACRWACDRTMSVPAALSPVATTAQDGSFFQAGGPDASVNAASAAGR